MNPAGGPARERDRPSGTAHPHELGGGLLLVGSEHHADHGQDGVKAGVGERQRLGIGLEQVDLEALGVRSDVGAFQE
jgi:hypothetical protein